MKFKTIQKKVLWEIIIGIVLFILPIRYLYSYNQASITGAGNVILVSSMVTGVSFWNLAWYRRVPKVHKSFAISNSRGGFLVPIAFGIEWLFGMRS